MDIVLSYTIQKIVSIDIPDYTLSNIEIDNKIDELFKYHAPEDFNILESDYTWFGDSREPLPLGREPLPTEDHWTEVDGFGKLATNGWAIVTPECPPINDKNISNDWKPSKEIRQALVEFFKANPLSSNLHKGYFNNRFLPLKEIPNLRVYGDKPCDPGFCYVGDLFVAVIMPVVVRQDSEMSELFQFAKNR